LRRQRQVHHTAVCPSRSLNGVQVER
jgi:hypothetical protein